MKLHNTEVTAMKVVKLATKISKIKYRYIGLRRGFTITVT